MKSTFIIICLLLTFKNTIAQRKGFPATVKYILVQLNTETNKTQYYMKRGKMKDAHRVIITSQKQRSMYIQDYTDNFTFCPVYYFMDTTIGSIKNKKFENCLLDAMGNAIPKEKLPADDSSFLVIEFGYPEDNTAVTTTIKGLIVRNSKFEQINYVMKSRTPNSKYTLKPNLFDITYKPFAKHLNKYLSGTYQEL